MRIIAWSSDVCSSDLCRRSTAWFMGVSRRGMRLRPHPRPNRYLPDLDTPRASRARDLPIHGEYSHVRSTVRPARDDHSEAPACAEPDPYYPRQIGTAHV